MMLEPIYRSGTNFAYMLYEYVLIIFLIFNTLKHKGRILKGYSILLWLWIVIVYLSWLFFYDSIYARASIIYIQFFFFFHFHFPIKLKILI